ncbi:MAG TPA: cytochrome P450 [Gammaproteobacteria bacterium]|nr:cytochrome P450 [Gammaproteobacteria bacterium]
MVKYITDYFRWLFLPSMFLFRSGQPKEYKVPGWEDILFVDNPDDISEVNNRTGDIFLGGAGNEFLGPLFGEQSVFLLDQEEHLFARKVLARSVSTSVNENVLSELKKFVCDEVDKSVLGGNVYLDEWVRRLTMTAMVRIVLGEKDSDFIKEVFTLFEKTTGFMANIVSYRKSFWNPENFFSVGRIVASIVKDIDKLIYSEIENARNNRNKDDDSVMSWLVMNQEAYGYDDQFIRDNVVSMIAAGYDTTGSSITWMLYWYSSDDNALNLGKSVSHGDGSLVDSFISETLRYCSPIEILPRKVSPDHVDEALEITKYNLESGEGEVKDMPMVCPCPHRVHHDPKVFDNPEMFVADRFLKKSYKKNEYLPFGGGRRLCLGANLGRTLLSLVIHVFIEKNVNIALSKKKFRPIRRNVSIWPGFKMRSRFYDNN